MPKTVEELLQENNDLLRSQRSGSGGGSSFKEFSGLQDTLASFTKFGVATTLATEGFYKLGDALGSYIGSWQKASELGISMGNDMFTFHTNIGMMRLQVGEFNEVMGKVSKSGFPGLAGGMLESTNALSLLSRHLSDTSWADKLHDLGYTTEQYNEVLALSLDLRSRADFKSETTQKQAADAAGNLALEITALTEATGIQRGEILEDIKRRREEARYQIQLNRLNPAERDRMMTISTDLIGSGMQKSFEKLFITQGGRGASAEDIGAMKFALGPLFEPLQKSVITLTDKNASQADKDAATAEIQRLRDENQARLDSEQFATQMAHIDQYTGVARKGLELMQDNYQVSMGSRNATYSSGQTETERIEAAKVKANAVDDKDRKKTESEALTDLILKGQRVLSDTRAKEAELLQSFTDNLSGTVTKSKQLVDHLTNVNAAGEAGPMSRLRGGLLPENLTNGVMTSLENNTFWKNLPTNLGKGFHDALTSITDWSMIGANFTGALFTDSKTNTGEPVKPQFADGTPGVADFLNSGSGISGIFENFGLGTDATLHGYEAVVRPDQMQGILNKATAGLQGALSNIQSNFNPEQIGNLVNTKLQEVTGNLSTSIQNAPALDVQISNQTLNDINNHIIALNTIMEQHLRDIAETMRKQYGVTKSMSSDVLHR